FVGVPALLAGESGGHEGLLPLIFRWLGGFGFFCGLAFGAFTFATGAAAAGFFTGRRWRFFFRRFLVAGAAVVSDVKTGAFENNARAGAEQALDLAFPPFFLLALLLPAGGENRV